MQVENPHWKIFLDFCMHFNAGQMVKKLEAMKMCVFYFTEHVENIEDKEENKHWGIELCKYCKITYQNNKEKTCDIYRAYQQKRWHREISFVWVNTGSVRPRWTEKDVCEAQWDCGEQRMMYVGSLNSWTKHKKQHLLHQHFKSQNFWVMMDEEMLSMMDSGFLSILLCNQSLHISVVQ